MASTTRAGILHLLAEGKRRNVARYLSCAMPRSAQAAVLIVFAVIGARQFSNAQPDTSTKAQQDASSNAEAARTVTFPEIVQLPKPAQPCAITTTTTIKAGDRTTTTTKTEPCPTGDQQTIILPPPPDHSLCCNVQRPRRPLCHPDVCPPVRVNWPRPDRWCQSGWCRPRPRRLCGDWIEDGWGRPPFDDRDDDRW